ncbi:hypothetical protein TARUN_1549 [Trichoderma arundinaceum]|uniref:Tat pathway signal sequence n=1 Tax=Trichoderma arundinaceum TaxID=490622 RepID=A0A395NX97_TRIAR|nr:hypothetical protein TARUN_1549 [Trichoderma arundinaceum]
MDRLRESALFIKKKAAKQEYSRIEGNEGEETLFYQPTSSRRWRLIPLISSFLLGVLTVVLALGLWQILFTHKTRPNRPFPAMREGTDEKTGLPLSWSHGDCGNSPADAQALGCRYSIVLHSWLPQDCLTDDDLEDESLMYQGRDWPYEINGRNLTMEELHQGDYGHFTTTFDWHVVHCMYVWKRIHRVAMDANQKIDSYTANFHHTNHCVKMIGGDPAGMKDSGTKIFVKYPSKAPDAEYKHLIEGEADSDSGENLHTQANKRLGLLEQSFRRFSVIHVVILLLEVILCGLLVSGFIVLNQTRKALGTKVSLDGLSQLGSYNTSMRFQNGSKHMAASQDADEYWRDLLGSGGNSIRQNLMSKTPPPWDETHMLHCLDYVRSQLLCHPDLTLVTTNDLEEFVLDEVHTCRDYSAMVDWVYKHRWVEFPEWIREKNKKNNGHEAAHNHGVPESSSHDHS